MTAAVCRPKDPSPLDLLRPITAAGAISKLTQILFIDLVTLVDKLQNNPRIELRPCNTFRRLPFYWAATKFGGGRTT
jgi:hypothetical protein